jgi:hypothetical protein
VLVASFLVTSWLIVRNLNIKYSSAGYSADLFLLIAFGVYSTFCATDAQHFIIFGASFALAYLTKSVAFRFSVWQLLSLLC